MWQQWLFAPRGESPIALALNSLPEDYVVLSDLLLPEGRVGLDHVVAGPNGLFTLEIRDWPEEVKCKGHDWFVGRKRIPSPGRQAQAKAAALRKSLVSVTYDGERKIPPVVAVLVFTHPEARVRVEGPAVPAMRVEGLARFLVRYQAAELAAADRSAIVQHLSSFPSRGRKRRRSFLGIRLGPESRFSAPGSLA